MNLNADYLKTVVAAAQTAAHEASKEFFRKELNGVDQFACGFAWVEIYDTNGNKIKGNTKLGKVMKQAGINQNWQRIHHLWNPAHFPCQNVDTLLAGAKAAAEVLNKHGFKAYACSRLD